MTIRALALLSLLSVSSLWAVPAPRSTGNGWGELHFAKLSGDALPESVATPLGERADELEKLEYRYAFEVSTYRATLPDGLLLYVQWVDVGHSHRVAFLLHDPVEDLVTPELLTWDSRWERDPEVVLRSVRVTDLEGDGEWELAYRHKEHNGTMWNAEADHYLQLERDLTLREEFQSLVSWVDLWSENETGLVRVAVHSVSSHELELEFWLDNSRLGLPREPVGSVKIERDSRVDAYRLVDRVVHHPRYESFVRTR